MRYMFRHSSMAKLGWWLLSLLFYVTAFAGPLDDIKPGHWYEVPDSTMAAVVPNPPPPGTEGPAAVISVASGAALDNKRDRLIVWGGGSQAYAGNELYAFDLNTLKWTRLTEPSRDVGGYVHSGYYPDGKPRARHTYDFIEYLPPPVDRFCSFGGTTLYPAGGEVNIGNVDCLDVENLTWERKANALSYGLGAMSAYDSKTGHVWVHGAGGGFLTEFDPRANRWYARGRPRIEDGFISQDSTAELDPERRKFVAVGEGSVIVWDISQPGLIKGKKLTTTGDAEAAFVRAPGLAYDPTIKRFVSWRGGAEVYILDIDKARWTKQPPAATNRVVPAPPTRRGTFGRFRYVPSKNVYVLVNSLYENVLIYRLDPRGLKAR